MKFMNCESNNIYIYIYIYVPVGTGRPHGTHAGRPNRLCQINLS